MFFAQQNYTVTEGGTVNITLVTSTTNYEFDFNVALQHMDGSATGESVTFRDWSSLATSASHKVVAYFPSPLTSWL